jgi:hypothetical protein
VADSGLEPSASALRELVSGSRECCHPLSWCSCKIHTRTGHYSNCLLLFIIIPEPLAPSVCVSALSNFPRNVFHVFATIPLDVLVLLVVLH